MLGSRSKAQKTRTWA